MIQILNDFDVSFHSIPTSSALTSTLFLTLNSHHVSASDSIDDDCDGTFDF